MKKWRCLVCGHIHEGDNPPEECPVCGAPKEEFVLLGVDKIEYDESKELDTIETDVIIVGSGAAGFTSAITARSKGLETIILEKGEVVGGTTARSGGRYWIPNNKEQKKVGIEDDREYGIKYMARYAFPEKYNSSKENYGLEKDALELIETYYDTGPEVLNLLEELNVLESEMDYNWKEKPQVDYMDTYEENKGIRGRCLRPKTEKGPKVMGYDLIQLLYKWLKEDEIDVRLGHRATNIILNSKGEAVGIRATSKDGSRKFLARKGVVFATGGFSHNEDLMTRFQYGPQVGGCASPNNEGDLINMSEEIGLKLGNMQNAYRNQSLFEEYLENPEEMPYVIVGEDLDQLTGNIEKRLEKLKDQTANFELDESFKENLKWTFERFNEFAKNGIDQDFQRGSADYDNEFFTFPPLNPTGIEWPPKDTDNESMYPLSKEGPYYAFILAPGTLDTNGGPLINKDGQMIRFDGEVVKGLYGAGNCIASPGKGSYWGAGATIGSGMIFGYRAASHLASQEDRSFD